MTQEGFVPTQKKQSAAYHIYLLRIKFFWFFSGVHAGKEPKE